MHSSRGRLRSCAEWTVATAMLVGLLALGSNLIGEVRRVAPSLPRVGAQELAAPAPPAAVPPRSVSVPLLPLTGDVRIRVGDFAADVLKRVQGLAVIGSDAVERLGGGERVTREFAHPGGRFHLVMESIGDGEARVTGIFVP
jgi:hypothetical protein